MTRVIEFLISLLIVAVLFVVIGLFLPAKRTFSHSVETNRSMTTVNDMLNSFTSFKSWNPLVRYDPRMQTAITGPESGVGARFEYDSTDRVIGKGSWEIVESVPGEMIKYELVNDARGTDKTMTITLERTGQRNQNVKITQRYRVNYGWDLIGRYAGLYVTRNVGDDIKRGLEKLSNLLATIPRFDYGQHPAPFQMVDLPAINALVVTTAAKRANDEIAVAMSNQLQWIEKVMAANNLEPAGPLRIVTNEFTTDTYGFDVVMPIRKKGTGPAPAEGEADVPAEGDAAAAEAPAEAAAPAEPVAEAAPVDPSAPVELLDVKVEGPVVYAQLPAIRAATTTYTGPSPGLARVRDLVRAWAMVRAAEPTDRPYEEYLVPIPQMLAEDAEFRVYWPVKPAN